METETFNASIEIFGEWTTPEILMFDGGMFVGGYLLGVYSARLRETCMAKGLAMSVPPIVGSISLVGSLNSGEFEVAGGSAMYLIGYVVGFLEGCKKVSEDR